MNILEPCIEAALKRHPCDPRYWNHADKRCNQCGLRIKEILAIALAEGHKEILAIILAEGHPTELIAEEKRQETWHDRPPLF